MTLTDPADDVRAHRVIAGIVGLGILILGVMAAHGDPPPPPVGATGACCSGLGEVAYAVTQAECTEISASAIWVRGEFDPTDDETPCDLLPGGD